MSDDFEEESKDSYGKELAKSVTTSVAGAMAMVVGVYAGQLLVTRIKTFVKTRQDKKTEEDSIWESTE